MFSLTILSIFRESASYLPRFFHQIENAFLLNQGKCHAIWLEGDSLDETFDLLREKKTKLEKKGHKITLIKYETRGPLWPSVHAPGRWKQLASCWAQCLKALLPSKIAVCVESDLIWDPQVIHKLSQRLDARHSVIYPMLMIDQTKKLLWIEHFSDTWGFSRNGKKFRRLPPYWPRDNSLIDEGELLQISTGGGMIVSSYECFRKANWDESCCILKFPETTKLFLDKTVKIYHPIPKHWEGLSRTQLISRAIKMMLSKLKTKI